MPGDGEKPQRPTGLIHVQECTAAFGKYSTEPRRNIGGIGWVSELGEKPGDNLSIIEGHGARERG